MESKRIDEVAAGDVIILTNGQVRTVASVEDHPYGRLLTFTGESTPKGRPLTDARRAYQRVEKIDCSVAL